MDCIFFDPDSSHVSVDTVRQSLLQSSSSSSPRWNHLQSLYSDIVFIFCWSLVAPMSRLTQSVHLCFSLPLFFSRVEPYPESLYSDVFLVSSLHVSKPPRPRFPAHRCEILYIHSLPDVIISHMDS